jgi:hypothetical protein
MKFGNERESGQIEKGNQHGKDQEAPARAKFAFVPKQELGAVELACGRREERSPRLGGVRWELIDCHEFTLARRALRSV